jgi:hypothetical protein
VRLGYEYLAEDSFKMGRWTDALQFAAQDRQLGDKLGLLGGGGWADFVDAHAYYGLGRLHEAEEAARISLETAALSPFW